MLKGLLLACATVIALLSHIPDARSRPSPAGSNNSAASTPFLEVRLSDIGFRAGTTKPISGHGIPLDLGLLNDDAKTRVAFVADDMLAVYASHYHAATLDNPQESRDMQAVIIDTVSGKLIAERTWPTIQRRWLNERWDTQARIMAISEGFLVHAGNSLMLYSPTLEVRKKLLLEESPEWAVTVPSGGRTIHLQRIESGDISATGMWFDLEKLVILKTQNEMAGATSASESAAVTKLGHCIQLQAVQEAPRNLLCSQPDRLGLPMFLSGQEVLSVYRNGFSVMSDSGETLWGRDGASIKNARLIASHRRSLDGSRFALLLWGGRRTCFDGINIPKSQAVVIVYDRFLRARLRSIAVGHLCGDFDLSPDGSVLAVVVGNVVRLYKISD